MLLHPTIYDTFAMVVAEAMAYGVPVIVSREAGIAELITHRDSGWLLSTDSSDTANALMTLQKDTALAEQLGGRGRMVAATRSWDDVALATVGAYHDAAATRR
ncbi:MAG: glycosyltransferase [Anaerolineae bacterium]|nr:glycosyltransferase [Gemmatimonadaceae bacterium]